MIRFSWLIVLLPFASFLLILFFGKKLPGKGAELGVLSIGAALLLSLSVIAHFVRGGGSFESSLHWITIHGFSLEVGEYVDGLTSVMFVIVTVVSLCVHVYSIGYMHGDRRYTWFFAVLSLFTASMLNLVIANNLLQLLVGWELVGLCSYLLIGHWWEEKVNSDAAIKAFITTKTGDVPFLFGIFVLITAAGTANISQINQLAHAGSISQAMLTAGALLLFGGAIGKSAQFPLHVWLPDAMAGPTPVSALIHAATMVTAGVYLVGRVYTVFENASPAALSFVATIAAITMLIAALLAMVQDDLKRVLAYSTISQLAYMMAGLSLGPDGYTAGLFHLFTHAFFKALLFLGAGSIIHAVHSNNMSEMGGLRKKMPVTFWTFLIGAVALMGIPPLAGFWSKDDIISAAWRTGHYAVYAAALATAVLTAFYMTRALLLTFGGEYRGHHEPHESPPVMTGPLVVLAGLSVSAGFLGAPQFGAVFADWVQHPFKEIPEAAFRYDLAAVSIAAGVAGILVGYRLYARWRQRDPLLALGPVYTLLEHKYYLDDVYMRGIVRPVQYKLSAAVNWSNKWILDGIVNGAAVTTRVVLANLVNWFDRRVVDGAVNDVAQVTGETGGLLKYLQSGNVQRYAVFLFGGVLILALVITRVT